MLLWCGFSTGRTEEAQLFIFSSSSIFLSSFLLCLPQPLGCVKTPWIIYKPTATGVTNARVGGVYGVKKRFRRAATNKELKGEGKRTCPCETCYHTTDDGSGYSTSAGNYTVLFTDTSSYNNNLGVLTQHMVGCLSALGYGWGSVTWCVPNCWHHSALVGSFKANWARWIHVETIGERDHSDWLFGWR